ncbi:MAG: HAD-IB family phosphatase [Planctomycetes bacterium]|uniref:HAD-IB family phosphatase n=1 Tax=Candidatus Wunengus californicus TaxID=3367619 RepID=UPI004028FE84|nr:HAD-IB family phosphatase [Planctomycetota bacterium]
MIHSSIKKLVVMDVDGVLFKGHFILHQARHAGRLIYIRTALLCFLFSINKISTQELITRVYARFKGITLEQAKKVYQNITVIKHARETIETLRKHGYRVVLISSGVPDFFVKDLATRLSAHSGYGVEIGTNNSTLTGEVFGRLSRSTGKKEIIEDLLHENNLTWKDTIVLVDDRNNLNIMRKASINIGVNAHYPVRQQAQYLIDSGNLAEALDILDIADADTYKTLFAGMRKQYAHSWYQEIRRKLLHILIACVPVFSSMIYNTTLTVLFALPIIYMISECLRINGYSFPMLGRITKSSIRRMEERGVAFGPVTLIFGTILSLLFFPPVIASTVILIVAFADAAATIVGQSMGNHRIFYNKKKSWEGTIAAWIVAFLCGCIYLPISYALLAASFSSIIESLPLKSLDNLLIPISTGILLMCLGYS